MLAARTQALILTGSNALLRAAAATGHVDQSQRHARLEVGLASSQTRWEALAGMWADLTTPSDRRVDRDLAAASMEVRASLRELLHDAATASRPAVIAQRTDLSRIPSLVGQVLAANLDLSQMILDATNDPRLTGAARRVNEIAIAARRTDPRRANTIDRSPLAAAVTPRDLLVNRTVQLPPGVRAELVDATGAIVDDARWAMSAGSYLGSRVPKGHHCGERSPSRGRKVEDRTLPNRAADEPGRRCER